MTKSIGAGPALMAPRYQAPGGPGNGPKPHGQRQARLQAAHRRRCQRHPAGDLGQRRSEEHTSELQSRLHLVCRLLLEKKKKTEDSISIWISGRAKSAEIAS